MNHLYGYCVNKKIAAAVALIGLLLGIGNPGAVVVCFGADGHVEVVPAAEDHCCDCPSPAGLRDAGHRCPSCFDIPLPLGTGEAFLLPVEHRVEDLKAKAGSEICRPPVIPLLPETSEASPGAAPRIGESAISSLSTVVLLI